MGHHWFIEMEQTLIRELRDPAWLCARIAARVGTTEPPDLAPVPPRIKGASIREAKGRPPTRSQQILAAAAELAAAGIDVTAQAIHDASGIPLQTIWYYMRAMRMSDDWPHPWESRRGKHPRSRPCHAKPSD